MNTLHSAPGTSHEDGHRSAPPKKLHILLVDDDADDHMIIGDLLRETMADRVHLDWEPHYEQAKDKIRKGEHDAYLVDYRLGAKTGLDLIRECGDMGNPAPFILLTGYGDHDVDLEAMKSGVSDFLIKAQLNASMLERSIRYSINHAEAIETLREREESLRSLFDAAFEGIFVLAEDGRILDANSTAGTIFGCRPNEMIGGFLQDMLIDPEPLIATENARQALGRRCLDGGVVHLELHSKPYRFRGRACILTACRDISERVQMEAQIFQQDRLASIGLLASSLAHEIGTPLGVIRGRAELLGMKAGSDPLVNDNVAIIVSQIDRVSKLIRSLLNLARGDKAAHLAPFDPQEAITGVMDLMRHEFSHVDVKIRNELPPGMLVSAIGGPLHQVFLNLFVNSLHAIRTEIQSGKNKDHHLRIFAVDLGDRWEIGVEDSGCGISKTNLKKLFTPFFTTKDFGVGTGLGLATSYRILEAWGGNIRAESEEGKGATFYLSLKKA
ncbi:MAG: ATP-binding protein [Bdellovibrionaceae bacterium]|nr:ATP-binding protein [Pseudobdellovibrionaceae bacterium]